MKFTHQKKVYRAACLQWNGQNFDAVTDTLRGLGYDNFETWGDRIMARGKGLSLLAIAQGNWLRIGENGSFKIMRPDDFALLYVPIQCEEDGGDGWAGLDQVQMP